MKLTDRGYWVSKGYKWMSLLYWSFFSVYFRSLTFFSVANPKIYLGGMLDERKSDIYHLIPDHYLPLTRLYQNFSIQSVSDIVQRFEFPIILKPNIGFKGFLVKKIENEHQLRDVVGEYLGKELIVQQFLNEPFEYSIMYYRIDNENFGISSLVEKHLPSVKGDGIKTLGELINDLRNPFLHQNWVKKGNREQLDRVLKYGEHYIVDYVGNYSRGSKFENINQKISPLLIQSINEFFNQVHGMNFCRLDVKANSFEELNEGRFKLLEINGAKSEPLHIYDARLNMWRIVRSIHEHWLILFKIVRNNIKEANFPSSLEGIKSYYSLKKLVN